MAAAHKFMFARDFADERAQPAREPAQPEPEPAAPPEPEPEPEPTYSAEELAAARAEGHAAGFAEGRQAADAEADRALSAALDRLAAGLETLAAGETLTREARDRQALDVCVGLLRRLFPALARRHAQGEIELVFQSALERLRDEPRVVVRCADRHLDALRERVDHLAGRLGFEGRVILLADDTMQPGDARVEWADGGVERDTERLWQDVERAAERALAPPPAPDGARPHQAAAAAGAPTDAARAAEGQPHSDGTAHAARPDTSNGAATQPARGHDA